MAFSMLRLKPGVNTELTPSQVEAGYASANLIRFRSGLAEKLGGWSKFYPFALLGPTKALHPWIDNNDAEYLGFATTGVNTTLGAITGATLTDITPQLFTSDFTITNNFSTTNTLFTVDITDPNISTVTIYDSVEFRTPVSVGGIVLHGVYPIILSLGPTTYRITNAVAATSTTTGGAVPKFTTTSGQANFTVTLNNHALLAGEFINFPLSTSVGGLVIFGTYQVLSITDANNFVLVANAQATSSTNTFMNGGQAELRYYIAQGPAAASAGYGLGGYSSGGYGTGSVVPAMTGTNIDAVDWTLDNWNTVLISVPQGGAIWSWEPNTGFSTARALSGNGAPIFNTGAFVATEIDIMVAYGSTVALDIGLDQDPLLVNWSNQGDYKDFVAGVPGSQAGSRRLSTGSKVVGACAAPQFNLLWTDLGLWTMSYIGPPGVFSFNPIGFNCGLIARHGFCRLGANLYWMGLSNFFILAGGAPVPIPCPVWDYCFQDLNAGTQDRSFAWTNGPFNEVWFFFPRQSTNAVEPDAYVKYNTVENAWDTGILARSAGIDTSILGKPIAADPTSGLLYEHETSPDADGQAINATFTTGLYQLSEGQELMFVDWVLPDMRWQNFADSGSASVQLTILGYEYLSSTPTAYGPFTVSQTTPFVNCRIRARFLALQVSSNDVGSFWRTGGSRFRIAMSGRR